MLIKESKQRITVEDALKHPWFDRYSEFISQIKRKYHPVIDQQTGLIVKPMRRRTSILDDA